MTKSIQKIALSAYLLFGASHFSIAQDNNTVETSVVTETSDLSLDDILNFSLEDLMDLKIVSASRKEESTFESPLSSFVISKKEISAMGATSIPDALRICPSLIIREVENGSYDVSIRGGIDGLPTYSYAYNNTSILVMIDNRPVFSYLQGGTYWQNLPIGLAEIERIEVVCGPSSALYGPNAVSGVINIISSRPERNGSYLTGIAQGGNYTNTTSIIGGRKVSDKFSMDIALNYDVRKRFDQRFYTRSTQAYEPFDSLTLSNKDRTYPDDDISMEKMGASMNLHYTPVEDIEFHFNSAVNKNIGLFPLAIGTSLAYLSNTSQNFVLNSKIKNFTFLGSYLYGKQGLSGYNEVNRYNYANTDFYVDYTQDIIEGKLSIKPALSYQSVYANDKEYTTDKGLSGTFNGEGTISSFATSLKADANISKKIRVILAGRYDKFNFPEKGVFSYQAIANYKLNEAHIFRVLTGKSYNGSFLIPTLINSTNTTAFGNINLIGNQNLELLSNTSYEVGYRTNIIKNMVIDIALFSQQFTDFNSLIAHIPEVDVTTGIPVVNFNYPTENLPLEVNQQGITIALQANLFNSKIQIRPNITIQQTKLKNYSPYYNVEGAYDNPAFFYSFEEHKDKTEDVDGTTTPTFWGGFNLIINPINKLTVDFSGYYYERYQLHSIAEANQALGIITDHEASNISSKFLLNTNVNYLVAENMTAFVNLRNITDQRAAEGFGSGKLGFNFLVGLKINY